VQDHVESVQSLCRSRLRTARQEVVTDKVPASRLRIGRHDGLHMGQKIFFCTRRSGVGSHQLSCHHITAENKGTGAVALVFKFAPLHFARSQRQSWMLAFERLHPRCIFLRARLLLMRQSWMLAFKRLHPGRLVRTHRAFALFDQFWSLPIDLADGPNRCFSLGVNWRRQPVADQVRLELSFLRGGWHGEEKSARQCLVPSLRRRFRAPSSG
jgi:hypothetical protein